MYMKKWSHTLITQLEVLRMIFLENITILCAVTFGKLLKLIDLWAYVRQKNEEVLVLPMKHELRV